MISQNQGLCTKNDVNVKFWAYLLIVMVVTFVLASSIEVEIYRDMKGSYLTLL